MFYILSYQNGMEYETNVKPYLAFFHIIIKWNIEQIPMHIFHSFVSKLNGIWKNVNPSFVFPRITLKRNMEQMPVHILYLLLSEGNVIWNKYHLIFYILWYHNEKEYGTSTNPYFIFIRITTKWNIGKMSFIFCIHSYRNEMEFDTNANPYFAFIHITMECSMEKMSIRISHSFFITMKWKTGQLLIHILQSSV